MADHQVQVQIRVPPDIVRQIDELVMVGLYPSRSEFFKRISIENLSLRPSRLIEWLDDPDVQDKVCKIVSSRMLGGNDE